MTVIYSQNGYYHCDYLATNSEEQRTGTGFDLEDSWNDPIYYVGQNDRNIHKIYYNNGSMHFQQLTNYYVKVRDDSEVKWGNNLGAYVREDGILAPIYPCGDTYMCSGWFNLNAPNVKTGTGFYLEKNSNNLYYIGVDDNIHKIFWTNQWEHKQLTDNAGCKGVRDNSDLTYSNGSVFYTGIDGTIYEVKDINNQSLYRKKIDELNQAPKYFSNYLLEDSKENAFIIKVTSEFGSNSVNIESSQPINSIDVYSIDGVLLKSYNLGSELSTKINLSDLSSGVYVLKIKGDFGLSSEKIILH